MTQHNEYVSQLLQAVQCRTGISTDAQPLDKMMHLVDSADNPSCLHRVMPSRALHRLAEAEN